MDIRKLTILRGRELAVAFLFGVALRFLLAGVPARAAEPGAPIRVGMIGLDAHAVPWTRILHAPDAKGPLATMRVVAAIPAPSADIPFSRDNIATNTAIMRALGVEICATVEEVVAKSDAVMVLSIDGRPHREQARVAFRARKPVFIDKPVAASLADIIAIYREADESRTPCFSNSSLRFGPSTVAVTAQGKLGRVLGCDTFCNARSILPGHPDLFYYGIHGADPLFALMGPGCREVRQISSATGVMVVGTWADGRMGTYRGILEGAAGYGATAYCERGIAQVGKFEGYEPLLDEIARFFATGRAPVSAAETFEIYAFLEAAGESARKQGEPVLLSTVLERARAAAAR